MYINASVFRKIENTLWKNLPESRHYDDIRRKLFQIFHTCIFPDFYRLEYFQSMGNRTLLVEGEGLMARCICHELDHLDGHMYTEKVEGGLHDVNYEEPEEE